MKQTNVASLERLLNDFFRELGGKVIACEMAMEIMGVVKEDMNRDLIMNTVQWVHMYGKPGNPRLHCSYKYETFFRI